MSKCILFIDGENLFHKVEEILKEGIDKAAVDLASLDLNKLFREALKGFIISRKIFYVARLHLHPDTKKKSEGLIRAQRKLRNRLVGEGYEFVIAGNVRAQKVDRKVIFREKGVDVRITVDLVSFACDKKIDTAILLRNPEVVESLSKTAK